MEGIDIKSLTPAQREEALAEFRLPAYRVKQIAGWLDSGADSFAAMTSLPSALREELAKKFVIPGVKIEKKLVSGVDNTVKYLYGLSDGEAVESVLMEYHHGWSQCLSTQVGCRMGCAFCATGMGGLSRNLLPSEMLAQIEAAQADRGIRVSSVVLMGMGEPLDNFDNVMRFLEMLSSPGGVQIGMRHVSLSTCGVVDKIYELMKYDWQLTLSISLHAPNNALRDRLMPINHKWPVETLLVACRDYLAATGRRISFEYAMMDGINDTDACAHELADKLKGMLCHVNLIPANDVAGKAHHRSSRRRLEAFRGILEKRGLNVTVRRTLGADINASCGQLRRQEHNGKSPGSGGSS